MPPKLRKRVFSQLSVAKPASVKRSTTLKRAKVAAKEQVASTCKDSANIPNSSLIISSTESVSANYWLMKAEPETRIVKGKDVKFSIDDLAAIPNATASWDGVRNYEARNIMRDQMRIGDKVLFYHSNCKKPGIAGVAQIVREGYPDHTALDPSHPYYDAKLKPGDTTRWFMVDVAFVCKFPRLVTLEELKHFKSTDLSEMVLLNRGRLSVQPVTRSEFDFINDLAQKTDDSNE
ncbi:thymocyte nuclear protein 1-like protein [Syncephalis fuscata]|nr:thymocyte nuclear protein 1-like protein [Syncephalis fuscata]